MTVHAHNQHAVGQRLGNIGIEPKYLAGNLARIWESVKNLAALGSQAEKIPMPIRIGLTVAAFYATAKMQGYYGKDAHDELHLDKLPDQAVGKPSWIDAFAPDWLYTRSDGPANFATVMSIGAGVATLVVRSKMVKNNASAKRIIDVLGKCFAWSMTGSETLLAQVTGRGVADAVKGVVAGGGGLTPNLAGAAAS